MNVQGVAEMGQERAFTIPYTCHRLLFFNKIFLEHVFLNKSIIILKILYLISKKDNISSSQITYFSFITRTINFTFSKLL